MRHEHTWYRRDIKQHKINQRGEGVTETFTQLVCPGCKETKTIEVKKELPGARTNHNQVAIEL